MASKRGRPNLAGIIGALSVLAGLFLVFASPVAQQVASAAPSLVPIDCTSPGTNYGYSQVSLTQTSATINLDLADCPTKDAAGNKITYYLLSYSAKDNAPYPSLPNGDNPANYPQYLSNWTADPLSGAALSSQMTVTIPGINGCWQIDLTANSDPSFNYPQYLSEATPAHPLSGYELTYNASTVPPGPTLPFGFFWGLPGPDSSCNSYGTTTTSSTTTTTQPTTSSSSSTTSSSTTSTTLYVPHLYIYTYPTTTTTTTTTTVPTTTTSAPKPTTTAASTTSTTVVTKSRHSTTTTTAPTTSTRPRPTTTTTVPVTTTTPPSRPTKAPKTLAYTGSNSIYFLAAGLALILAGSTLLVVSGLKRRRA